MPHNKIKYVTLGLILIAGLMPRILVLTGTLETLVQFIPDDAFYYFQVARNIVSGHGSSFDGLDITNGYHPLWMIAILPVATLIRDPSSLLRIVLGLQMLLCTGTSLLLYTFIQKITKVWWLSAMGAALYFLDWQAVLSSVDGLETSISSLLFMASLLTIVGEEPARTNSNTRVTLIGILLGFLFLARTDNIFYLIVFFFIAVFKQEKRSRLMRVLFLGSLIALVSGPWILWSWVEFGTPIQVSGLAIPYVLHENFLNNGNTNWQMFERSAGQFLVFLFAYLNVFLGFPPVLFQSTFLYSLIVLVKKGRDPSIRQNSMARDALLALVLLWAAGILLIFVHTFVRWYSVPWYFDQLIILAAITFSITLWLLQVPKKLEVAAQSIAGRISATHHLFPRAALAALLLPGFATAALAELHLEREAPWPHQVELLDAADWLKSNLPENGCAASFNSGIMGFLSGRCVVNLDGAINNAAYSAITRRTLFDLMRRSQVLYYLDFDPVMLQIYAPYIGASEDEGRMIPIDRVDRPNVEWKGYATGIRIYRLAWVR